MPNFCSQRSSLWIAEFGWARAQPSDWRRFEMAALVWAQLKSLPRLVWANLVVVLSLPVFTVFLGFIAFATAQGLTQLGLIIFALAVALFAGILMVWRQEMMVSQDEWVLAQPLNAQTFAAFSWLISAALWFFFWAVPIVSTVICATIGFGKVIELPSASVLVVVLALNSLIGSFSTASRLSKRGLALVGQVWHIWTMLILLSAVSIVVIIAVVSYIYGSAIAVEWRDKIARWVETPAGMLALLPIMPAYFAVKSVIEGFNFIAVLWLVLLALIALVVLLGALELARPFNESAFLQSQRMRRLSAMGIWDTITAKRKRIRSVSGFGKGETVLLWLNWLSLRRTYGIAFIALLFTLFMVLSMAVLLSPDERCTAFWGIEQVTQAALKKPLWKYLTWTIVPIVIFSSPLIIPISIPEWLKSQPISVRRGLFMLVFPLVTVAFLFGIGILLAVAIFRLESLSAIQVASFVIASFGAGLGIGFSAQATKFSLAALVTQRNYAAMSLQYGITMCFVFLWLLTLTDFWLFGLLLTWVLTYEGMLWAELKWHDVP